MSSKTILGFKFKLTELKLKNSTENVKAMKVNPNQIWISNQVSNLLDKSRLMSWSKPKGLMRDI